MPDPKPSPALLPTRCLAALDKIEALRRHARTDAIDMIERIRRICDEALVDDAPMTNSRVSEPGMRAPPC